MPGAQGVNLAASVAWSVQPCSRIHISSHYHSLLDIARKQTAVNKPSGAPAPTKVTVLP